MTLDEARSYLRTRGLPDDEDAWESVLPVTVGSLFGCYLTQDWPEEHGSWQNAVRAWLAGDGRDPSERNRAIRELEHLLEICLPDAIFREIGGVFLDIEYWPDEDFNEWLRKVQRFIADAPPFPDPDPLTVRDLDPE